MKHTACLAILTFFLSALCFGADDSTDNVKKLSLDDLWEQADLIVIIKKGKHKKTSNKTEIMIEELLRGDSELASVQVKLYSRDKINKNSTGVLFLKKVKGEDFFEVLPSKKTFYNPDNEELIDRVLEAKVKHYSERLKNIKKSAKEIRANGGRLDRAEFKRTYAELKKKLRKAIKEQKVRAEQKVRDGK